MNYDHPPNHQAHTRETGQPDCYQTCRQELLNEAAELGMGVNVGTLPPIVDTGYEPLGLRCRHGIIWFAEPTTEQITQWRRDRA
jgi:hypothetical protein